MWMEMLDKEVCLFSDAVHNNQPPINIYKYYVCCLITPGLFCSYVCCLVYCRTAPVIEDEGDFIGCSSPQVLSANQVEIPFQHATPLKPPSRVCCTTNEDLSLLFIYLFFKIFCSDNVSAYFY